MKKLIFIISFLLAIGYACPVYATETNETIKSQESALGIASFIKEAGEYTKELFDDVDLGTIYKNAISGNIDTKGILGTILKITGNEVKSTLKTIGYILIIIIIHSIIKSLTDGMGNGEIGEITYYVQYILIVTLIMTNFSGVIVMIKDTVNSLVGFLNSLIPILITLMITTGNLVTASTVQPLLMLIITFVGNTISSVFLPLILVGTSLGIISKISDKLQINKISKLFKSGVVWALGIVLTVFVRSSIS